MPDFTQSTVHAIFVAAIYDGVARAARDWLVEFLKNRKPSNLRASLATLPRVQEIVGSIEARLAVNARLIDSFAGDFDDGAPTQRAESNIVKLTVTNNAVAVVEDALSLTSNHGLTRANPLERHFAMYCAGGSIPRRTTPQRVNAGRLALGV